MTERSDISAALQAALGDRPQENLDSGSEKRIRMIQALVDTLRMDALDPVPKSVIKAGHALSEHLPKAPSWFDRAAALLLEPLFDDRPRFELGLRGGDLRQCTYAVGEFRLDMEIECSGELADDSVEPLTKVRGQIDGEQALPPDIPVVAFIAGTSHVAATTVTRDGGRFDLTLPAGEYEFAFQLDHDTQVLGRMEIP